MKHEREHFVKHKKMTCGLGTDGQRAFEARERSGVETHH